ncbi:hypothetical protein PMAYCL1PPCAC_20064, partial [Pristionchus mayeri]
ENSIRRACRSRNGKEAIVALGCVLEAKLLEPGQKMRKNETLPGKPYSAVHYECKVLENNDLVLVTSLHGEVADDEKNPCGEKKIGDVWNTDRFMQEVQGGRRQARREEECSHRRLRHSQGHEDARERVRVRGRLPHRMRQRRRRTHGVALRVHHQGG